MSDAGKYTINAARNAPWARELTFTDCQQLPIDFTGWTGILQVRLYEGAPGTALISLGMADNSSSEGLYFFPGDPGHMQIMIAEAALNALPGLHEPEAGAPQRFFYDMVLTDPDGFEQRFMEGPFIVQPGVSR